MRNPNDYKHSDLPIWLPEQLLNETCIRKTPETEKCRNIPKKFLNLCNVHQCEALFHKFIRLLDRDDR